MGRGKHPGTRGMGGEGEGGTEAALRTARLLKRCVGEERC